MRTNSLRNRPSLSPRAAALGIEALVVAGLIGFFAAVQIVLPVIPGTIPENHVEDMKICLKILDLLRHDSLWNIFWSGRLPAALSPSQPYQGVIGAYLYLPVYVLFGANAAIAENWHLVYALSSLIFAYLLMRDMFGRAAGILALVLLAAHPSFVEGTRLGAYTRSSMHFFSMGSLFFLSRWRLSGKPAHLALGLFILGLGMSFLLHFYWVVVGMAVAAGIFGKEIYVAIMRGSAKTAVSGLIAFAAGAWLLIYREIFRSRQSMGTVLHHLFRDDNPNSLRAYFRRIGETFRFVNDNLSGADWTMFCWPGHLFHVPVSINEYVPWSGNPLFPWALWASVAYLLWRGFRSPREKYFLILPVIFSVMVLLTPLSTYGVHMHLFVLYPFPELILAGASVTLFAALRDRLRLKIAFATVLGLFIILEARGVTRLFELHDRPVLNYPVYLSDVENYRFSEEPRDVHRIETQVTTEWRWPGLFLKESRKIPGL